MSWIHPTAQIAANAKLADNITIGPYCVVGDNVCLEEHVVLHSHVVIMGHSHVGAGCEIFPFASIGSLPQDLKYKGEASQLEIGAHCIIREHVTINPGTHGGGMLTKLGQSCLLMIGTHVAHDVHMGDHVIIGNHSGIAGHVYIEDYATIGGMSGIHQFVRIGRYAMVGGMSGIPHDVIPYGAALGNRAHLAGLNLVGLKRHGFRRETINDLRTAYRLLFAEEGTMGERLTDVERIYTSNEAVMEIVAFIRYNSHRSLLTPTPSEDA